MIRDLDALLAYLAGREAVPFGWWHNDCATYAAGAVAAQTGCDPLAGLSRWRSARGAARVLARAGGMVATVNTRLRSIATAAAQRGDIAGVVHPEFGVALMVVEGATLVGPGEHGARRLHRAAMVHAWSAAA